MTVSALGFDIPLDFASLNEKVQTLSVSKYVDIKIQFNLVLRRAVRYGQFTAVVAQWV